MPEKKINAKYAVAILILYFTVGIAGMALPSLHPLFVTLTPVSLLLSLFILLLFNTSWHPRLGLFFLIVFTAGIFLEAIGVNTGVIFGAYEYGSVLGPKIWHTPLMIGVNWLMLTYMTWDMTGRLRWPVALRIPAAAALMVLFDVIMEPVAIKMGMWTWDGQIIPVRNYLAWFVISLAFFGLAAWMKIQIRNRLSIPLWLILFVFFILLNLLNFS